MALERRLKARGGRRRGSSSMTTIFAQGEPFVWLTAGGLVLALGMIAWLLVHVLVEGLGTFWPRPIVAYESLAGERYLGELDGSETYVPQEAELEALPEQRRAQLEQQLGDRAARAHRVHLRTGNYDLTGTHTVWLSELELSDWEQPSRPHWALTVERTTWGRFYGTPSSFVLEGRTVASTPAECWALYQQLHPAVLERIARREHLEKHAVGALARRLEDSRLRLREVELEHDRDSAAWREAKRLYDETAAACALESERLDVEIVALREADQDEQLVLETADGVEQVLPLASIVRAYPANQLTLLQKLGVYLSRWGEFVSANPREANSEGGVFPAIFGTVVMTLIMSVLVVPFGVLAALYLREYARQGFMVSLVRVAVNNLAGVPSIVFGVFGLGFFCYIIGVSIDELLFSARLPNPTFGKGGLMWASFTLALLTLPVVIVATEEAVAAVSSSMREGSYACGATKWQTIRRIVLPRAMPGIMTGMILAIARGAGEVAPLMLVGAVKLAPELPVDGVFPFVHPERSFMHLGFHIYDLGFQSQNIIAATPMVYTTTLLLIGIIVLLNLLAIGARARLRRKFDVAHI